MPYYITPGYNQPEIYNKLLNANTEEEKYLIQKEIADLNRVALKKAKLERQNVIQAENLASKRGKLEGQNTLKTMKEVTGYAPMGGLPSSQPPLTTGFGGTINFGGDTGNKNMLYVAGGVVALIIAIGVSFNVGRKRSKRRR